MERPLNLRIGKSGTGFSDQHGMTLVETVIALFILLVGLLAMAQVMAFSVVASKTHGRDAGKVTTSARDKMEELTALQFTDTTSNVTVPAPYPADGAGLAAGGSLPPDAPVYGYADYLDADGQRTAQAAAAYTRQWRIIDDSSDLKRIIVAVTSNKSFQYGVAPSTIIVTYKSR